MNKNRANLVPGLLMCLSIATTGVLFTGCTAKPNESEIVAKFAEAHNTTRSEEWSVVHITSIEVGKPFKNKGHIDKQPNERWIDKEPDEKMIVPVTVLWNNMHRRWRFPDVSFEKMRDEWYFLKNAEGSWNCYHLPSKLVGTADSGEMAQNALDGALAALSDKRAGNKGSAIAIPTPDAEGFDDAHTKMLGEINALSVGKNSQVVDYLAKVVPYLTQLTGRKDLDEATRAKLRAEMLEAISVKAVAKASAVQQQVSQGIEATAAQKEELDTLSGVLNDPAMNGMRTQWKSIQAVN